MPTISLGKDAKIYFGSSGSTASTEMSNVTDVNVEFTRGEADTTTRANQGWRSTSPTLRECTVTFDMLWDPDDEGFAAILAAYLADDGLVALLVLDKAGGQGPDADFSITGFSESQPLDEAIKASVTAKLATFREWAT